MTTEQSLWIALKQQIETTYKARYPDCSEALSDWKGKEIKRFQQDLSEQVQGQVSEKWFYTYFKKEEMDKLPRIDVLHLLAQYIGYANWDAFAQTVAVVERPLPPEEPELPSIPAKAVSPPRQRLGWLAALVGVVLFAGGWWWLNAGFSAKPHTTYTFCLVNADSRTPIRGKGIEVYWLKEGESPAAVAVDTATGCLRVEAAAEEKIQLAIAAPYYHRDTLVRVLSATASTETIALRTDDYALMLHYFSTTDWDDWQKRRDQLDALLAEEAQIVQVYGDAMGGVALYNKPEFIDKLTMPLETLNDIEILETRYDRNGKIIGIRFR